MSAPLNVLVVDDEGSTRDEIEHFLARYDYDVTTAEDGEIALDLYDSVPADIVITDLRMPRLDGFSLIRALRERAPFLPVVVVTGTDASALDFDDIEQTVVLAKPASLRDLRDAILELAPPPDDRCTATWDTGA